MFIRSFTIEKRKIIGNHDVGDTKTGAVSNDFKTNNLYTFTRAHTIFKFVYLI